MSSDRWLLRGIELSGMITDCRIAGGRVAEVGPGLVLASGERVIDGGGGALIPGLADHHAHVLATAAARSSVDLEGSSSIDDAPSPGEGWLRVIGAGVELHRRDLDARWPDRPVRVQHRSGALWTLNSAAVESLSAGLTPDERETGQLWRADERLRVLIGLDDGIADGLRRLGQELASYGITHVTDASPDLDASGQELTQAMLPQHLTFMSEHGTGPRKIVLADHDLPSYDNVREVVGRWHAANRPVAVHAVTSAALALCIAVFSDVGVLRGDRVEHAAVCNEGAAEKLAELGVVVVTQPTIFARHERRFVAGTPPDEVRLLWRHAGLRAAGVRTVVSSDAPYGDLDPARTIAVCAVRPGEEVAPRTVLESYLLDPSNLLGGPRTVDIGRPADLVLLGSGLDSALVRAEHGGSLDIVATFIDGRREHVTQGIESS